MYCTILYCTGLYSTVQTIVTLGGGGGQKENVKMYEGMEHITGGKKGKTRAEYIPAYCRIFYILIFFSLQYLINLGWKFG